MPAIFPVRDARSAVMVVPTLAPRIIGKAFSRDRMPAAIRGISNEVVTELLWIIAVNTRPVAMAKIPRPAIMLSALPTISDFMILTI